MVPAAGLEPARANAPRILSPLCLPIPSRGRKKNFRYNALNLFLFQENFLVEPIIF